MARNVADDKARLRAAAKAVLSALDPGERAAASARAAVVARASAAWPGAALVLAFLSMPAEIDTGPVIRAALADGKRVAVPRIQGGDIAFVELAAGWQDWPRDRWNIPAPPDTLEALSPDDIAAIPVLALVPGLAFDRKGRRLGRGKGYYDRFLSSILSAKKPTSLQAAPFTSLGFGYRNQVVEVVPMDERDHPLDGLALG